MFPGAGWGPGAGAMTGVGGAGCPAGPTGVNIGDGAIGVGPGVIVGTGRVGTLSGVLVGLGWIGKAGRPGKFGVAGTGKLGFIGHRSGGTGVKRRRRVGLGSAGWGITGGTGCAGRRGGRKGRRSGTILRRGIARLRGTITGAGLPRLGRGAVTTISGITSGGIVWTGVSGRAITGLVARYPASSSRLCDITSAMRAAMSAAKVSGPPSRITLGTIRRAVTVISSMGDAGAGTGTVGRRAAPLPTPNSRPDPMPPTAGPRKRRMSLRALRGALTTISSENIDTAYRFFFRILRNFAM